MSCSCRRRTAGRWTPAYAAELGELRGLRWRDVDTVARRIVVRVAADDRDELHPPKSGKPREVPLGDDVREELRAHRHLRAHVFDNADGSIMSAHQARTALDRIIDGRAFVHSAATCCGTALPVSS